MLRFRSLLNNKGTRIKKVSLLCSIKSHYLSTTNNAVTRPSSLSRKTHFDSISSVNFDAITQSLSSKYPQFFNANGRKRFNLYSLNELLLDISDVIPDLTRRFSRILRLKPEDVLEMLLGFQFQCEKVAVKSSKVESLWGIFNLVCDQDKGFKHLPKSCEVMGLVLIKYGMFREVQLLLLAMERQAILLDSNEIFCKLIEGYVGASDFDRAVLVYDRMREQGLVPSLFCHRVLVDLLVRMRRTQLAFRVCLDMVESGSNLSDREIGSIEKVIRLLCENEMVQEARNMMKKFMALGFEPNSNFINDISSGYCEKKDFEDLLNFFVEMKRSPDVLVGNKIIYRLCSSFGVDTAEFYRLELEYLGFMPDEITFGILLGSCCVEGNLRGAFIYLSEMSSRGLKPVVWSYNAIIGALFREGMWKQVQEILDEMVNVGITPNLSIFRTLLAGYCKARQFEEVKMVIQEMVNSGLIESSSLENPLSKAFMILGFSPFSVRLRRDNDVGFSKTEFFDNLGNGLYLDTDLDEYEKKVSGILEGSAVPDFNLILKKECDDGNFKAEVMLMDEIVRWGQEVSLPVFSILVKGLCASRSHIRACSHLIENMPKLANQLDGEVLNFLVQAYCKSGLVYKGRIIFNQMILKETRIENGTYTALMVGLCKRKNLQDIHEFWDIAQNSKWLPGLEDFKSLLECLCHHTMVKEALGLLESMVVLLPHSRAELFHMFLEKLSIAGYTSIAHNLVDELFKQGCIFEAIDYNHLLRGFCKERNYALAFSILDEMLGRSLDPCLDISLVLIPWLCRADRLDKAITLRDIVLREQSAFHLSVDGALIRGFYKTGNIGKAANVVQNILSKGLFDDIDIYDTLLQAYCQANNFRKVKELLSILMRKFVSPSITSYQNLVCLMCKQGSFTSALSLKMLMLRDSRHHSLVIYNILVFHLLSAGNRLQAVEVLDEVREKKLLLDKVSYNFLVYGFSKCKDVTSVVHYLYTMISKGFRPNNRSLRTAVTCLCDLGELHQVMELSREMEMRGWIHGSFSQNAIVERLLSHNMLQEAECFLDRLADKGLIPDTINYDNLIKRFCLCGRLNKAVDLLNIMLRKGNVPNSASYDSIIHRLCVRNQLNEAMDFHTEMLHRNLKPSMKTWDVLVHKLCQHGQTAAAENLLISMARRGATPTKQIYNCVINSHRFENNPRKASAVMQMMQHSGYEPDFDTHWSLISNLQNSKDKDNNQDEDNNSSRDFLSKLLSGSGFSNKKESKFKVG